MRTQNARSLTANCSLDGATLDVSFDEQEVVGHLQKELATRLGKKGVVLSWQATPKDSELRIRIVRIDEGNRFLRYLFPLLGRAALEVEGEVRVGDSPSKAFRYTQKTMGFVVHLSGAYLLKWDAIYIARKIAKDALSATA